MTFSLPVKQQGIWKCQAAETPTCLSFIKVKMQSPKEIEVVTNLIATALYRDKSAAYICIPDPLTRIYTTIG